MYLRAKGGAHLRRHKRDPVYTETLIQVITVLKGINDVSSQNPEEPRTPVKRKGKDLRGFPSVSPQWLNFGLDRTKITTKKRKSYQIFNSVKRSFSPKDRRESVNPRGRLTPVITTYFCCGDVGTYTGAVRDGVTERGSGVMCRSTGRTVLRVTVPRQSSPTMGTEDRNESQPRVETTSLTRFPTKTPVFLVEIRPSRYVPVL